MQEEQQGHCRQEQVQEEPHKLEQGQEQEEHHKLEQVQEEHHKPGQQELEQCRTEHCMKIQGSHILEWWFQQFLSEPVHRHHKLAEVRHQTHHQQHYSSQLRGEHTQPQEQQERHTPSLGLQVPCTWAPRVLCI